MRRVRTLSGDRLDLLCFQHYGSLAGGAVERVLEANRGAAMWTVFPAGVELLFPDLPVRPRERSLW